MMGQSSRIQESPRPVPQETEPGLYRIPYIPYGLNHFYLGIQAAGYGSVHTDSLKPTTCENLGPIDFAMSPGGSVVAGVVNAFTEKPIVGIAAGLIEPDSSVSFGKLIGQEKMTDANGSVRLDNVAVGRYRFVIWRDPQADDYEDQVVVIERGKTAMIEARVKVRGKLRVDVVDRQGKPIEHVAVSVTRDGKPLICAERRLDAGGYLFMTFDAGPCHVEATGPTLGDEGLSGDAVIRAGEETSLVLKAKS